jgi:murein DD-endopeptidase MepM/ murein hydrolase activator NlpD
MDAKTIGQKIKEVTGAYKEVDDEKLGQGYLKKYGWVTIPGGKPDSQPIPQINQSVQRNLSYNSSDGSQLEQLLATLTAPITQGPNGTYSHKNYVGWDYGVPTGTPLKAQTDIQAEYMPNQGIYGNRMLIKLPNGKKYYLSHLSGGKSGTYKSGEVYGQSGNTGKSTGPHLEIAPG